MTETTDSRTTTTRTSDLELVVTRTFNAPARLVFQAWSTAALFQRWWVPKSAGITLVACEMDVRTSGKYKLEFGLPSSDQTMAFFGRYIEVIPNARIVWTNEEGGEDGAVTTVTLEEKDGQTLLILRDVYPTKEALDAAIEEGGPSAFGEQFAQLDDLLITLA